MQSPKTPNKKRPPPKKKIIYIIYLSIYFNYKKKKLGNFIGQQNVLKKSHCILKCRILHNNYILNLIGLDYTVHSALYSLVHRPQHGNTSQGPHMTAH